MFKMNGIDVLAQIQNLNGIVQVLYFVGVLVVGIIVSYMLHLNGRIKKLEGRD